LQRVQSATEDAALCQRVQSLGTLGAAGMEHNPRSQVEQGGGRFKRRVGNSDQDPARVLCEIAIANGFDVWTDERSRAGPVLPATAGNKCHRFAVRIEQPA